MHQHLPNANDVTNRTCEDEEMEHGMNVGTVVRKGVDDSTRDVTHTLGHEPPYGGRLDAIHEGPESYEAGEPHEHEARRLDVAVLAQAHKADDGARDGGEPHKAEQTPPPPAGIAHGDERDGRIAARNVPVDGGVVKMTPHLARRPRGRDGMVDCRADIACQHTTQIQRDGSARPIVAGTEAPHEKNHPDDYAEEYARCMAPRVEGIFAPRIVNHGAKIRKKFKV